MEKCDVLIVGLGFAGAVTAERMAAAGKKVIAIDRRDHLGGNCYDYPAENGILVHRYGPHIFHTNSPQVWDYLSRFTDWLPYEHRVKAQVDGRLVTLPVNFTTIEELCGSREAEPLIAALTAAYGPGKKVTILELRCAGSPELRNLAELAYQKLFFNYTLKQWGVTPEELDPLVTARVPLYTDRDDRYFRDKYQGMPKKGYLPIFQRLLANKNITVRLNCDFRTVRDDIDRQVTVYTGRIDEYFDYVYGQLPYRSLDFRLETIGREYFQEAAVVNYPGTEEYTRITEFKRLTGQKAPSTVIAREFPKEGGRGDIPYYPIPRAANQKLYKKYRAEADRQKKVVFIGRLGEYRYYNMDEVVARALDSCTPNC